MLLLWLWVDSMVQNPTVLWLMERDQDDPVRINLLLLTSGLQTYSIRTTLGKILSQSCKELSRIQDTWEGIQPVTVFETFPP